MQREGSTQDRKDQNISLFLQITENLVVLYLAQVELSRHTARILPRYQWLPQKVGKKEKSICTKQHNQTR